MYLLYVYTYVVSPEGTIAISEDILTTFDSSVNITCSAEGGPNNVYEWRKQGELIFTDSELYLQSITGSDGGVYQCTVINAAGSDAASTLLSGTYIRIYLSLLHVHVHNYHIASF